MVPLRHLLFVCTALLCGSCTEARSLEPGDKPSPEHAARVEATLPGLREALLAKDEAAVYRAVEPLQEALGLYAGLPESPEKCFLPIHTQAPDTGMLNPTTDELLKAALKGYGSRSAFAQKNQMELREAAYVAIVCMARCEAGAPKAQAYAARAREELDYLLARQHATGLFPYPADPRGAAPAHLRATAERLRKEAPERIWKGYLIIDDAGNQFDTGCCAYALVQGYRGTGEERYLAAAKRAADWAAEQHLAPNWNYNAFSVWQLAALYGITKTPKYLDSAIEKALIGVLPGLMPNGRWVDQHNAKQTYHFIMVRALTELLRVLPLEQPRHKEIKDKTLLATESRARDILRDGVSNSESAIWGLSVFLDTLGPNEVCEKAVNAIMNATVAAKKPALIAWPQYLLYKAHAAGTN